MGQWEAGRALWGESTPRSRQGICYSLSESEMPWSPTLHTSRLRSGQWAEAAVGQREGKLLPRPWRARVGAGGNSAGIERESGPRLCPKAWAKGMSPTCATSSPSFKYRIGAGWAGTRVSLLQPWAKAPSPRPSPAASLAPAPRPTKCGTQDPGRTGRRKTGADRDPPPVRSTSP